MSFEDDLGKKKAVVQMHPPFWFGGLQILRTVCQGSSAKGALSFSPAPEDLCMATQANMTGVEGPVLTDPFEEANERIHLLEICFPFFSGGLKGIYELDICVLFPKGLH